MQDRANIVPEAEQSNTIANYEVSVVHPNLNHISRYGEGTYLNRLSKPSSIHDPETHGECIYIVIFGSLRRLTNLFFRPLFHD